MKTRSITFSGYNLSKLEQNIKEFEDKLDGRILDQRIASSNPKWVIVVEYEEED